VLGALVGLFCAGLTESQISNLTDLRILVQRGSYAADGGGVGRAPRGGAEGGGRS
jgi:hypothetical protein